MREDWIKVELGKVCDFIGGGTPSKKEPSFWNGNIPWASIKDIKGGFLTGTQDFITEQGLTNSASNLALPGEIILGTRINPGRPIISKIKVAINQDLKVVKPKVSIDTKFLFYSFIYLERNVIEVSSGTTVLGVNLNNLWGISLNLAPLPEQRAIVAKLEQLFSELDNGITNLKAAKDKLEIYRQAVLKKAFEGALKKTVVGEKFDFIGGGTPSKKEAKYWNGDIPWCSVKDVKGDFLNATKDKITKNGVQNSATNIAEAGEVILITRISPGKSIIPKIRTAINQDLKIVKPKVDYKTKFIHYLFKSIKRDCIKVSSGTTVLGINLNNLKALRIPDIPPNEQNHIIEYIETRLSVCDNVLSNIEEGLEKSEALRQSILKKAFEGKLLSETELEACRKEPDWEPAEKLLERIRKDILSSVLTKKRKANGK